MIRKGRVLQFVLCVSSLTIFVSCGGKRAEFFRVENGVFMQGSTPYYFIGTNFWYGAVLGSKGEGGNRERLHKELDFLKSIGITNLRVIVGGEGEVKHSSKFEPVLQPSAGEYNEELLDGLDYFMYQLQKRGMNAVLYLTNAWEWSGGFTQYLEWSGELDLDIADIKVWGWGNYGAEASKFVRSEKAKEMFADHVRFIVSRTNSYTGEKYVDDPAIFSWQLCNEPRAFGEQNKELFYDWVAESAALIRSIDANHMISTGSEGEMGCENDIELFEAIHSLEDIAYLNAHMWSLNWGWIDPQNMDGTIDSAIVKCEAYIDAHIEVAQRLGKPLVMEEFGLPRNQGAIEKGSPTTHRDRLYAMVFDKVVEHSKRRGVFAGCNFWSWGGFATQVADKPFWAVGQDYSGDPPQEAQGLNSIYVEDKSTIDIIKNSTNLL